jgi:hypothetical protein
MAVSVRLRIAARAITHRLFTADDAGPKIVTLSDVYLMAVSIWRSIISPVLVTARPTPTIHHGG